MLPLNVQPATPQDTQALQPCAIPVIQKTITKRRILLTPLPGFQIPAKPVIIPQTGSRLCSITPILPGLNCRVATPADSVPTATLETQHPQTRPVTVATMPTTTRLRIISHKNSRQLANNVTTQTAGVKLYLTTTTRHSR